MSLAGSRRPGILLSQSERELKSGAAEEKVRALGIGVFLAGCWILSWVASEALGRQAAQREAKAALAAEAESLAAIEFPVAEAEPSRRPPARGSVIARIAAPALGLDVVAHEGVDRATLDRGAGHFPGTALPGEPGNSAFAAHRDVEFRGLRNVTPGDDIYVDTGEATFAYRVADTRVVEPTEVHVLAERGASDLTLITCYPFDWVGPAPKRFVVRAELRGRFESEDRILADVLGATAD